MDTVIFKRIAPDESRIHLGGEHVGDVYRRPDCLVPGSHYYVIHIDEDFRGPIRVHRRERIHEVAEHLVDTHPLWQAG